MKDEDLQEIIIYLVLEELIVMFMGEPRRYEINVLLDFNKTGRGCNGVRVNYIISIKGERGGRRKRKIS